MMQRGGRGGWGEGSSIISNSVRSKWFLRNLPSLPWRHFVQTVCGCFEAPQQHLCLTDPQD